MPFYVYILRSVSNELYIGQTNNLNNREKQQLNKTQKAAKFVKDGKEWNRKIYSIVFPRWHTYYTSQVAQLLPALDLYLYA